MSDRIKKYKNIHLNFIPPFILRHIILNHLSKKNIDFPDIEFKVATSSVEIIQAFQLLKQSYIDRGIVVDQEMYMKAIYLLPTTTTFIASKNTEIIGTISLIKDSELGLPMEAVHKKEVRRIRHSGRHISEVSSFAISPQYRRTGLSLMLYNMLYQWASYLDEIDDLLIATHPSMKPFYSSFLFFSTLGPAQKYQKLSNAISIPMRLNLNDIQEKIYTIYGKKMLNRNVSVFDFFCGKNDQFNFLANSKIDCKKKNANFSKENTIKELLKDYLHIDKFEQNEIYTLCKYYPSIRYFFEKGSSL